MTKEELESKFEDYFHANTRASEGGYGPDVTDRLRLWWGFEPIILEFTKQQAIAFFKFCLPGPTDFEPHISQRYAQFIEHQKQTENK